MTPTEISRAIGLPKQTVHRLCATLLDERFAFLREVIAVSHPNLDPDSPRGEHWGYLVRDMRPFPEGGANACLVPGFALYGRDFFEPDIPLLLYDLIGDEDPLSYVLDNMVEVF